MSYEEDMYYDARMSEQLKQRPDAGVFGNPRISNRDAFDGFEERTESLAFG